MAPVSEARQLYNAGRTLLKARQFAEAVDKLTLATEKSGIENLPFDEQALMFYVLGLARRRADRDAEAMAALRRSIELNPDDPECRLELAQLALRAKQYAEARRQGEEARRLGLLDEADRQDAQQLVLEATARASYAEGRDLLKARKLDEAARKLKEAAAKSREAGLSVDEQALCHYMLGLALIRGARSDEATAAFREALRLTPQDAEMRLELAQALLRNDRFDDARREGELAQRLGLRDPDDQKDAAALIKLAKRERLRERLTVFASASLAYDSNVLQSARLETIAGQPTGSPTKLSSAQFTGAFRDTLTGGLESGIKDRRVAFQSAYDAAIVDAYSVPKVVESEYDLPITLALDVNGRLLAGKTVEFWIGYRFYQQFMSSVAFDHDVYNTQEHTIPIFLQWNPVKWFQSRIKFDGYVNFSGLKEFLPFQGGFLTGLETLFIESPRWRTRLTYQHQLRRSFDRSQDSYLDADRDEIRLVQELRHRVAWLGIRGQLGYRFRSERAGDLIVTSDPLLQTLFFVDVPLVRDRSGVIMPVMVKESDRSLGYYTYVAPLGYIGNEISTRWRFKFPHKLEMTAGFSYEFRSYVKEYRTIFTPADNIYTYESTDESGMKKTVREVIRVCIPPESQQNATDCTAFMPNSGSITSPLPSSLNTVSVESKQRRDHLVIVDIGINKTLPYDFNIELSYSFWNNLSNIVNALDNRNYTKHTVTLTASYSL